MTGVAAAPDERRGHNGRSSAASPRYYSTDNHQASSAITRRSYMSMPKSTAALAWTIMANSLLWTASPDSALAQTVAFNARRDVVVGLNPQAVAVADLNGDGKAD